MFTLLIQWLFDPFGPFVVQVSVFIRKCLHGDPFRGLFGLFGASCRKFTRVFRFPLVLSHCYKFVYSDGKFESMFNSALFSRCGSKIAERNAGSTKARYRKVRNVCAPGSPPRAFAEANPIKKEYRANKKFSVLIHLCAGPAPRRGCVKKHVPAPNAALRHELNNDLEAIRR